MLSVFSSDNCFAEIARTLRRREILKKLRGFHGTPDSKPKRGRCLKRQRLTKGTECAPSLVWLAVSAKGNVSGAPRCRPPKRSLMLLQGHRCGDKWSPSAEWPSLEQQRDVRDTAFCQLHVHTVICDTKSTYECGGPCDPEECFFPSGFGWRVQLKVTESPHLLQKQEVFVFQASWTKASTHMTHTSNHVLRWAVHTR